jgi:hypothetical protein
MLYRERGNYSKFAQDFSELLTAFSTLEPCLTLDIVRCIVRSEFLEGERLAKCRAFMRDGYYRYTG